MHTTLSPRCCGWLRAAACLALLCTTASCTPSEPSVVKPSVPPAGVIPLPPEGTVERPAGQTAAPAAQPRISVAQLLDVHRATAPRAIDGDRFLFLSDAPGTAQIFMASAKDASTTPRQLTSFPDHISGMRIASGGKVALFLKDAGGDENYQIHSLDLSAEPVTTKPITETPKVRHSMPVFDQAGTRIAYTSNARNGKDMDLYVEPVLPSKPDAAKKPFLELSGSFSVADFHNNQILMLESLSNVDNNVWLVDVTAKKKQLLTKHQGSELYREPAFSRDGKAMFVLTDAGREWIGIVAIDLAKGTRTAVLSPEHDINSMEVVPPAGSSNAEDVIAYVVNAGGVEEVLLVMLDAARKPSAPRKVGLSGVLGSMHGSPAGDAVFVAMERADLPVEVFRVDVATASAARVTHSHHAGINESDLVREELLSVPTFDGRKISVFWYSKKPGPGEKLPVVVQIHGGPESQAQPSFNAVTQMLALNGYAVAVPNVRGSTGYGKAFAHLDDKERREDSVRDIHEVGKFLAQRPDVDPKKIVLYGGSYGGYMVLAGLTLYPEQWAAGVDIVGIANFRTFLEQTAPYRRALREAEYGSLEKDGALLDRLSPLHRVDRIRAPLMVIHGTRDPRVPIGEARQITEALKKRGQPVELLTFDDEGHGLAKRKNRLVAYPAALAFLDKYVKGKSSAPAQ